MSIKINVVTPQKRGLAKILHAIAEDLEESTNATVSLILDLTYNTKKKDC
jgi:hypothetical protein